MNFKISTLVNIFKPVSQSSVGSKEKVVEKLNFEERKIEKN